MNNETQIQKAGGEVLLTKATRRSEQVAVQAGERLLTLAQVGERLQIGRTSVWKAIVEGGLRRVKFGKIVRVKEGDLLAWIEKHAAATEGEA